MTLPRVTECAHDKYLTHKASVIAMCNSFANDIYFVIVFPRRLLYIVSKYRHFIYLHKSQWLNLKRKPSYSDFYWCFGKCLSCMYLICCFHKLLLNKKAVRFGSCPYLTANRRFLMFLYFFVDFRFYIFEQSPTMSANLVTRCVKYSHLAELNIQIRKASLSDRTTTCYGELHL